MSNLLALNSERSSDHQIVPGEPVPGLIGEAPALREILARLPTLAKADGAVLISGETGTGKELVARAIHRLSRRASFPFVAMNCGSLVDTLFESEVTNGARSRTRTPAGRGSSPGQPGERCYWTRSTPAGQWP